MLALPVVERPTQTLDKKYSRPFVGVFATALKFRKLRDVAAGSLFAGGKTNRIKPKPNAPPVPLRASAPAGAQYCQPAISLAPIAITIAAMIPTKTEFGTSSQMPGA